MFVMTQVPDAAVLVDAPGVGSSVDGEVLRAVVDAPAGAWTAVVLEGIDPASLPVGDLPDFLRAAARVQAWAAGRVAEGVAQLAAAPGVDRPDVEVAVALAEPLGAAQRRIWQVRRLRRLLPGVFGRLSTGELSERHANAVVEATARVEDPDLLARVSERLLARAAGKTAVELARHARTLLRRWDPAGAQARTRAARADADVTLLPGDEDGMAALHVAAPVEDAAVIKAAVDAYAAAGKAAGDPRRIGVLRTEALTGWAADHLTGHATAGAAPRSGGRPVEIGIVTDLDTALGRRDLPGEVPGVGLVPREVIGAMIATCQPRLRLLVADPDTGRLLYRAVDSYRPTAEQVAHVRAAYVHSVGPGSQVLAGRCDIDHVVEHPHGDTVIGNLVPLDRSWHNSKTRRSLRVTIDDNGTCTVTTALGQTRTVTPYDYRLAPDDDGAPPEG